MASMTYQIDTVVVTKYHKQYIYDYMYDTYNLNALTI